MDPWAIDYDTALNTDPQHETASEIDLAVERPAGEWQPVSPTGHAGGWQEVLFLDGSRRLEARLHLEDDTGHLAYGALATTAVGAVRTLPFVSSGARATFARPPRIRRWCLASSGLQGEAIGLTAQAGWLGELTYLPESFPESDPAAVIPALQKLMHAEERELASDMAQLWPDALLIFDGSLPFQAPGPHMAGYLKTFSEMRVGGAELQVVRQLREGQRSPLYLVRHRDSTHAYFEWFLRLRDPLAWHNTLAGMVRMQVYASSQPDRRLAFALSVADWSALHLPSFATRAHQDPRAPQQLLPIRALEAELRRHMGHPLLLNRRMLTQFFELSGSSPTRKTGD
jgi:hypothetical protein